MDPERWQEIDRIFAAALERDPHERTAFLDEACGGDQELRKEVESLLIHDSGESLAGGQAIQEATRILANSEKRDLTNKQIGPYLITGPIGAGGMGEVYLAKDKLGRTVALKLLNRKSQDDKSGVARFQQEARTLLALNHPHIVTIYDIDQVDSIYYIASELVEGETVRETLNRGDVDLTTALEVAIQIATALTAAHEKGIVHRDIKPENIMLRPDGFVKVLDFGIAKLTSGSVTTDGEAPTIQQVQTAEGAVIGTAAYMSPEQARGLPVDGRTDIWSLGVILYETLGGRKPFSGKTTQDVITSILQEEPAPLARYATGLPDGLEWIVSRALRKEKEARYQTASELLIDLKELKRKVEFQKSTGTQSPKLAATPPEPAPTSNLRTAAPAQNAANVSSAEYIVREVKRHRLAFLIGLLVLVGGIVGLVAYLRSRTNQPAIRSIAVLPFANESGNSEVDYLSDGMTETLINSLSQVPGLSVKARASAFRYKGKEGEPQRVGSELSVQTLLTGRVVQKGDDLTVYLSLVEASTGNQLWGNKYDRKVANLLSLQQEIARDVSQQLRTRLSSADQQKVAKSYTANPEAYQLFLKGHYYAFQLTPEAVQKSISYHQQAIDLDPSYAMPYVGLSEAYRTMAIAAEMTPAEFLPKAKAAAQKAVDLEDGLSEGHTSLGACLFWYDWDWKAAEEQYKRALELNPNSPDAHLFYAHLLSNTGRSTEALQQIKLARELDPLSPFVNSLEAQFLHHAGRNDEALARLRETVQLAPGFWLPHVFAASIYIEKGMYAEAVSETRQASKLSPRQTVSTSFEAVALAESGKREEAQAKLDELLKMSKDRFVPAYHVAMVYNALGQREQTFVWLDRAIEQRDPKMTFLKVEPKWNILRDEPRFKDVMRRVNSSW